MFIFTFTFDWFITYITILIRVEVPEQFSTEQRCFRDFKKVLRWTVLFQRFQKNSALISAVSEWVKKTSANQRCFRAVQRWFSLNQCCSALDQNEVRNRWKCFVWVQKSIGMTKNMFFWSVPAMKKNHSGEIPVKNLNWHTHLFLMLLGCTCPVE